MHLYTFALVKHCKVSLCGLLCSPNTRQRWVYLFWSFSCKKSNAPSSIFSFLFTFRCEILWPESTNFSFLSRHDLSGVITTWENPHPMGVCRRLGKSSAFLLGQAEACRRLMEEEVSAENSIHMLYSQDRARHSLKPHLTINTQQALTNVTYDDDKYWVIWKRWYHACRWQYLMHV